VQERQSSRNDFTISLLSTLVKSFHLIVCSFIVTRQSTKRNPLITFNKSKSESFIQEKAQVLQDEKLLGKMFHQRFDLRSIGAVDHDGCGRDFRNKVRDKENVNRSVVSETAEAAVPLLLTQSIASKTYLELVRC